MNHREHRGSQEFGVVQPWEGMPFRRAVHLIWRTYGTAEAVPFHNPRVFQQPASVMSRRAYLAARARPWARCEEFHESEGARATLKTDLQSEPVAAVGDPPRQK